MSTKRTAPGQVGGASKKNIFDQLALVERKNQNQKLVKQAKAHKKAGKPKLIGSELFSDPAKRDADLWAQVSGQAGRGQRTRGVQLRWRDRLATSLRPEGTGHGVCVSCGEQIKEDIALLHDCKRALKNKARREAAQKRRARR